MARWSGESVNPPFARAIHLSRSRGTVGCARTSPAPRLISTAITHMARMRCIIRGSRFASSPGDERFHPARVAVRSGRAYIALAGVLLVDLRLLVPGWRGTLLAWLAAVWVANIYMSLFARLRLDIKRERVEISQEEHVAARLASDDDDETARQGRAASH